MKRIILILSFTLVIVTSASSQWYSFKYGVSSLDKLTKVQLEESLKEERTHIRKNLIFSGVGCAMVTTGIIFIKNGEKNDDIVYGLWGLILAPLGFIILPLELILLGVHLDRSIQIKNALKNASLKATVLNCPSEICLGNTYRHNVIGITICFNF